MVDSLTDSKPARAEVVLRGQKVELIFDHPDRVLKEAEISPQEAIQSFIRSLLTQKRVQRAQVKDFVTGLYFGKHFFPAILHTDPRIGPHLEQIKKFYFKLRIKRSKRIQIPKKKRTALETIILILRDRVHNRRRGK